MHFGPNIDSFGTKMHHFWKLGTIMDLEDKLILAFWDKV